MEEKSTSAQPPVDRSDDGEVHSKGLESRRGGRAILIAAAACLAVVLSAELLSAVIYREIDFANAYDAGRNPRFRRGWEEYTRPMPGHEDAKRIIVISNSQGFLRERREPGLNYAAQLERELNRQSRRTRYEILNWSIPGARSPEMTLLAARAGAHDPDVVLLVIYAPNFTQRPRRIGFYISDVHRMAYLADVRRHLPRRFIERHEAGRAVDWLRANSYVGRIAHFLELRRRERWSWVAREPAKGGERPPRHFERGWNGIATAEMKDFLATLASSAPRCRLIIINMPQNPNVYTEDGWRNIQSLTPAVRDIAEKAPNVEVLDATEIIPPRMFYKYMGKTGRGAAAHMAPEAHREFALWLKGVILSPHGRKR